MDAHAFVGHQLCRGVDCGPARVWHDRRVGICGACGVFSRCVLAPFAIGPLPPVTLHITGLIMISALGSAFGNLLIVLANRTTPASVIAPLIYSQLLVATVIGFVVFGDWPDAPTFIGLAIIAVAGASSVWFAICLIRLGRADHQSTQRRACIRNRKLCLKFGFAGKQR